MVAFHHAYTAPINPAGATPVLTRAQVWAGLQRKVRKPTEFVAAIKSSEIVSESEGGDVVTRHVEFGSQVGGSVPAGRKVREVCTSFAPTKIVFEMETGDRITNVVSAGPSGQPEDLFLTYIFDLQQDVVDEQRNAKLAKDSVDGSIATLRRLATEGQI